MCSDCVCARCGLRAFGMLPDGTMLCQQHYEEILAELGISVQAAAGCRRCGNAAPPVLLLVAHGLPLCGICNAAWLRMKRDAHREDAIGVFTDAHPELAEVADVYAKAAASGLWDSWL